METEKIQNYANHARFVPGYHVVLFGLIVLGLIGSCVNLYASLAVLSRATSSIEAKGVEKSAEEVRLARVFIRGARHRIVGQLKDMDRNLDPDVTAISETAYGALGYAFPYWE